MSSLSSCLHCSIKKYYSALADNNSAGTVTVIKSGRKKKLCKHSQRFSAFTTASVRSHFRMLAKGFHNLIARARAE